MKPEKLAALSTEELIKKKNQFKGIAIGFGVMYVLAMGVFVYLLLVRQLKNVSVAAFIPLFGLPASLTPFFVYLGMLNKELKSRGVK